MEHRKNAVIDLTGCKYLGELHKRIKTALAFPTHYGENWSAFWDCLRFDTPVTHIKIIGTHTLPPALKEQATTMQEILQRCKEERAKYGHIFDYEIID